MKDHLETTCDCPKDCAGMKPAEGSNSALIGLLASDIYEAMLNLKGKFIHHENEFLPANVVCDFVGKAKFLELLERVIAKHIGR